MSALYSTDLCPQAILNYVNGKEQLQMFGIAICGALGKRLLVSCSDCRSPITCLPHATRNANRETTILRTPCARHFPNFKKFVPDFLTK